MEHLRIGECIFTRRPAVISTVLGSCVSVTFFHPSTLTGAVFHAMLPEAARGRRGTRPCLFVDRAMDLVFKRFHEMGVALEELEVKLFGGGVTTPGLPGRERAKVPDVGAMNVAEARRGLSERGLVPLKEDVGGFMGRKILFDTATGRVMLARISVEEVPVQDVDGGR